MRKLVICALCVLAAGCTTATYNHGARQVGNQGKTLSDPGSSQLSQLSTEEDCEKPLAERIQIQAAKYEAAGKLPPPIYLNKCVKRDEPRGNELRGSEQTVIETMIFRGSSPLSR